MATFESLPRHKCQHGKGESVHETVRVDELVTAIRATPCCSKADTEGRRHDPGCWVGCQNAILQLLGAIR